MYCIYPSVIQYKLLRPFKWFMSLHLFNSGRRNTSIHICNNHAAHHHKSKARDCGTNRWTVASAGLEVTMSGRVRSKDRGKWHKPCGRLIQTKSHKIFYNWRNTNQIIPLFCLTFKRRERNMLHIRNQSVPRCKHFSPRF
jgi:hypothetical protein